MAWSISFLPALRATVVVFAVFIVLLVIIDLVMISRISTHVQDITRLWKDQPIVSVYASSSIQGETCSEGFEILPLSYVALPFLSQASCGCTQNPYGYSSSVASCFVYKAMDSGQCTDDFTAEILMSRLTPTFLIYFLTWALFTLILVTSVVRFTLLTYNFSISVLYYPK